MDEYNDSVMVALLPAATEWDWNKIECPHLTLVYAGKADKLKPTDFNEMAKDAASIAMLSGPIWLKALGTEVFGGGEDELVNVLRLAPSPELLAMRRSLEGWNDSEYSFKPHVTIGPINEAVDLHPQILMFDRIMVAWAEEKLTFWLKR